MESKERNWSEATYENNKEAYFYWDQSESVEPLLDLTKDIHNLHQNHLHSNSENLICSNQRLCGGHFQNFQVCAAQFETHQPIYEKNNESSVQQLLSAQKQYSSAVDFYDQNNDGHCYSSLHNFPFACHLNNQQTNNSLAQINAPEYQATEFDTSAFSNQNYASNEIDVKDAKLIINLLLNTAFKKPFSRPVSRKDVTIKTIFRIMRQFYNAKLNECTHFRRKKKQGEIRPHFITQTDIFITRISTKLEKEVGVKISLENLSHHLAALIYPKSLSQRKKYAQQDQQVGKAEQHHSLNIYLTNRERIIQEIAQITQGLLYNYNTKRLTMFTLVPENVILAYYFFTKVMSAYKSNTFVYLYSAKLDQQNRLVRKQHPIRKKKKKDQQTKNKQRIAKNIDHQQNLNFKKTLNATLKNFKMENKALHKHFKSKLANLKQSQGKLD